MGLRILPCPRRRSAPRGSSQRAFQSGGALLGARFKAAVGARACSGGNLSSPKRRSAPRRAAERASALRRGHKRKTARLQLDAGRIRAGRRSRIDIFPSVPRLRRAREARTQAVVARNLSGAATSAAAALRACCRMWGKAQAGRASCCQSVNGARPSRAAKSPDAAGFMRLPS